MLNLTNLSQLQSVEKLALESLRQRTFIFGVLACSHLFRLIQESHLQRRSKHSAISQEHIKTVATKLACLSEEVPS